MDNTSTLDDILEAVRALSPSERTQLRRWLDEMNATPSEDAFADHLAAQGLLERKRSLPTEATVASAFQPVAAKGKPASEIIIEARR